MRHSLGRTAGVRRYLFALLFVLAALVAPAAVSADTGDAEDAVAPAFGLPTAVGGDTSMLVAATTELASPRQCGEITVYDAEDVATLCAGSTQDATPITSPTCPQTVSGSVRLETDLVCTDSTALIVGSNNTVIDLNGHQITCRGEVGRLLQQLPGRQAGRLRRVHRRPQRACVQQRPGRHDRRLRRRRRDRRGHRRRQGQAARHHRPAGAAGRPAPAGRGRRPRRRRRPLQRRPGPRSAAGRAPATTSPAQRIGIDLRSSRTASRSATTTSTTTATGATPASARAGSCSRTRPTRTSTATSRCETATTNPPASRTRASPSTAPVPGAPPPDGQPGHGEHERPQPRRGIRTSRGAVDNYIVNNEMLFNNPPPLAADAWSRPGPCQPLEREQPLRHADHAAAAARRLRPGRAAGALTD